MTKPPFKEQLSTFLKLLTQTVTPPGSLTGAGTGTTELPGIKMSTGTGALRSWTGNVVTAAAVTLVCRLQAGSAAGAEVYRLHAGPAAVAEMCRLLAETAAVAEACRLQAWPAAVMSKVQYRTSRVHSVKHTSYPDVLGQSGFH